MKKSWKNKWSGIIFVLFMFASLVSFPNPGFSESSKIDFDDNDRYDIYFGYDVLKDVQIIGSKDIGGIIFLPRCQDKPFP